MIHIHFIQRFDFSSFRQGPENNFRLFSLDCPADGKLHIRSLREADASHLPLWHGIVRKVEVLGNPAQVAWTHDGEALHVDLGTYRSDMPVVVKIITD